MKMKKICLLLPLILILLLAGCGKKSDAEGASPAPENAPLISEDYSYGEIGTWWAMPLAASENGFYYRSISTTSSLQTIHYCDMRTQKDIVLCNKPECRHDGNEFCVATNANYSFFSMRLYSGRLYIGATCTEKNTISFKLLRASTDGSSLDEVVTFYTYNAPDCTVGTPEMIIHRNKVIAQLQICQNPEIENTLVNGTAVYDLETQELTWLDEQPLSADNPERNNLSAYQDYLFYMAMDKRKALLHRYHLSEGTDEAFTMRNGFKDGAYVVFDEDTVYYSVDRQHTHFCVYHIKEQRSEVVEPVAVTAYGREIAVNPVRFFTDGEYLYFLFQTGGMEGHDDQSSYAYENCSYLDGKSVKPDQSNVVDKAHLVVFTPDFQPAAYLFNIPDYRELTGKDYVVSDQFRGYNMHFHFTKDTVYLTNNINSGNPERYMKDYVVYAMSREDLLSGEGTFQPLFNP